MKDTDRNGDSGSAGVDESNEVFSSIKGKLDTLSPSPIVKSCCIYKVHDKFRKVREYAYTPEMVSIGPLHHGKSGLETMEDHKLRYMRMLLSRTTMQDAKLKECIESIHKLEDDIRKCYSVPINLDSKKFVEMMVVDGLFIIELFGKTAGVLKTDRDDPIFYNIWSMPSLVRDMILLENQIPMFVVDCLFEIVKVKQPTCSSMGRSLRDYSLTELALHFFDPLMIRDEKTLKKFFSKRGKHFLDLLGKTFRDLPKETDLKLKLKHIPCVTELRQAGVTFKKGSAIGSFLHIKFSDGVLEIPPILVQDQTDTLLRNLIASEQCCDGQSTYMTSYAFLMDSLINSPADVSFLRQQGIITNNLGDDQDVSNMFNKLCREVTLVNFYYSKLCDDVNRYYGARWHVWRATLKRDYFNTPWAVISFAGAILLIFLTLAATVFAVLSFFVHKS